MSYLQLLSIMIDFDIKLYKHISRIHPSLQGEWGPKTYIHTVKLTHKSCKTLES